MLTVNRDMHEVIANSDVESDDSSGPYTTGGPFSKEAAAMMDAADALSPAESLSEQWLSNRDV